jgi:chemotaxis protein methyltransferase CheR
LGAAVVSDDVLALSDEDYAFVASLLYSRFGIQLGSQKRILVAGRLSKRVRQLGLGSFPEYFAFLRADSSGNELSEFINRLTTNHSFFYREKEHYEFLRKAAFPAIRAKLERESGYQVRMWSAGCAAGEEVYTLAMVTRDFFGPAVDRSDFGLLATDISLAALKTAREGKYPEQRLSELPPSLRSAAFREAEGGLFEVSPEIKRMVLFKRLNLMAESYPFKNPFDIVFCRNVMIYFDQASRASLVRAFYRYLKPGGYLFIGHSETIPRADCPFDYVQPAIYRKGAGG